MKKQNLFYVFKLSSSRIKKAKYNIELSINEARRNGELISLASNQVVQSVLRLQNREFSDEKLRELFHEKNSLKKSSGSKEKSLRLEELEKEINSLLFIPEIVSVVMDKKNQYDGIIKNGFKVNGKEFVRLLCGAGHSRRNTVIFCDKEIEVRLKEILNNGRHLADMVLAKNNAYFALSYSGTLSVSEPYFCVVPDYEIQRKEWVDFIDDNDTIITEERELLFNIFDGQGIISPRLAKQWAEEIGITDYVPSAFIIRNSFLKGMVCVVDFHKFSDECGVHLIRDAWGDQVNIRDMDLVLTTSQFKGWNSYLSCREYIENCRKNNFSFGITRVAPKVDYTHVFSNYQFLQVLNLNNSDIENVCSKTLDYFGNILGKDVYHTLLYLMGNVCSDYVPDVYGKLSDPISKALILNNDLIEDPYIKNHLIHSLNKKIKESYIGNLLFNGNYSFIVQDPYAFMEYLFGLPVQGLLKRHEHYSNFWNNRNVEKVCAMRAPLTWRSESNVLSLVTDDEKREWYKHLGVGCIVYNIHDCSMMLHADADSDGDLVFTTDQKEFVEKSFGGLPITYEKKKAKKQVVDESLLWEIDKLSFDSKIGYITNCSTTLYSMLEDAKKEDISAQLLYRLKLCRKLQGNQIDLAKGIFIKPMDKNWTNWTKITEDMSDEDRQDAEFNNSILIEKRPYFFRYLYSNYNRDYNNFYLSYDNHCTTTFGKSLDDLMKFARTEEELKTIENYKKYNPMLDSPSVMNKICHYLESQIKEIKPSSANRANQNIIQILKNKDIPLDNEKLKKIYVLYKKYKSERRNFMNIKSQGDDLYKTLDQYSKYIRQEAMKITNDISELANIAVAICYEVHPSDSKSFAWGVFSEGIIANIEKNRQEVCRVPFRDPEGNIEFLGERYSLREIKPFGEDIYEFDF